ncbi:MAG: RsmB/NOP family class I SAM-dependent RNA methyltransferase [Nitrososphaerota archaeon]
MGVSEDFSRLSSMLPDFELELYLEAVQQPLPECVRINTLKFDGREVERFLIQRGWRLEPLAWARHGYRVLEAPAKDLGNTMEHLLGLIYIQGPVSMLPVETLEPGRGERCLDLCAAPGSKSTQIAQLIGLQGVIVANDASKKRIRALSFNLQRWGAVNSVVTLTDGRLFHRWGAGLFDRVLLDVPCSALGIVSKDWGALRRYRSRHSEKLQRLQLSLLESGYRCLRPGGLLVYSTCTIHPLENEAVISQFLEKHPESTLEPVEHEGLKGRRPIEEFSGERFSPEVAKCFKCYPQDNMAEGFFVARIRSPAA